MAFSILMTGCANTASQSNASASASTSASVEEQSTGSQEATAAVDNNNLDYAKTFPSWNPKSESLKALVEFVKSATDESSDAYVAPEDRIATFDMDGTIICEKAPTYVDYMLLLNRVLDNPEYNEEGYKPSEETVRFCEGLRKTVLARESRSEEQSEGKAHLIASEFAGMTPAEFHKYVQSFLKSVDAVGFEGMTYGESFYKPMIEVINYLQANDFDVWMVSACEREFVRAAVPTVLDIPADHIIGTDVAYNSTKQGDKAYDEYSMELGEDILLGEPLGQETGETGKSIAIMREIGKRPVLAFGNSSGDYAMLNFAQSNPEHKGMGVLVLCDDVTREYGDEKRAAEQTEEATKNGWTLFHMSDKDWATIYGDGVSKVEAEELANAA
ncbi:MAG: HAD family hydrolase [Coriobacteriales bacterium]|nr:HAD family hydrolase [Coriobacteriales bacterium]